MHAGYFFHHEFWGAGYATQAFGRIVRFAFEENNVYRISAGCLAENAASERVMQKCGFIREAQYADHEWHDTRMKTRVEYRLLKSQWRPD